MNFYALLATTFTLCQYASPWSMVATAKRNNSAEGLRASQFLLQIMNCSLWEYYALLSGQTPLMFTSFAGISLGLYYLTVFYQVSRQKISTIFIVGATMLSILLSIYIYLNKLVAPEYALFQLGTIASFATVGLASAPAGLAVQAFQQRNTQKLPFWVILMSFAACSSWMLYGVNQGDMFLIVSNGICSTIAFAQLSLFIVFPTDQEPGLPS